MDAFARAPPARMLPLPHTVFLPCAIPFNPICLASRLHLAPPEGDRMPVVKITGQGLSAIALLVALLWTFLIAEWKVSRRAMAERAQALEEIHRLRRHGTPEPVSVPVPHRISAAKPALG
jgi:hypothetical protein